MVDVEQGQYWMSEAGAIGKVVFVQANGTIWMCYDNSLEAQTIGIVELKQTHIRVPAVGERWHTPLTNCEGTVVSRTNVDGRTHVTWDPDVLNGGSRTLELRSFLDDWVPAAVGT